MFVDKTRINVRAGDGGSGSCSFRREKYIPKGGPDGGDGGAGGNVILEASTSESSLVSLVYKRSYRAKNGTNGAGKGLYGRKGDDIILKVPVGTVVRDIDSGELIADLDANGSQAVVARGGRGGRGNIHFATSTNRAPRKFETGREGEERHLELELKMIADAGLVGYPNAGKSTLISNLSDARPKVAPYPFTTLHPVVGVVEYPDYQRLTLADIPGLIDGAHRNVGLGHAFLRHIERTSVLLYVLDMGGVDGRTPWDDLASLEQELELYLEGLSKRPSLIVANKMDLPDAEANLAELQKRLAGDPRKIIPVSVGIGETGDLAAEIRELVYARRKELELEKLQKQSASAETELLPPAGDTDEETIILE
ncbi:MAG: GTPase ObgE [Lentisphaerae bacterium]|nr:GTPase ObgE [Lentisphaerota bacterium]